MANFGYSFGSSNWSDEKYAAFMNGCTYNDSNSQLSGVNPFHGQMWYSGNLCNFINCYRYITKIAVLLQAGSTVGTNTITQASCNMYATDYNAMKGKITSGSGIGGVSWASILTNARTGEVSVQNTPENRAAFVYGMALHAATDTFAHSTWRYATNNTWYKVIHTTQGAADDADNSNNIVARDHAANFVALKVVYRCQNNMEGTLEDFIAGDDYFDNNYSTTDGSQDFLIGNYRFYAENAGSSSLYSTYYNNLCYGDLVDECNEHGYILNNTYGYTLY